MKWREVTSIEDVESYVLTHEDRVAANWSQMLEDMSDYGDNYTVDDFIDEAVLLANKGKALYD